MSKRPFQFHLSTALIVMLIGGPFVALNVRSTTQTTSVSAGKERTVTKFGFPFAFYTHDQTSNILRDGTKSLLSFNTGMDIIMFCFDAGLCVAAIYLATRIANSTMARRQAAENADAKSAR